MTRTDLCVNKPHQSRSYLNHFVHGSVHRELNLMTVQQDVTYSVYYISVGSSTCFRH